MAGTSYALRVTQGASAGTVVPADAMIVFGRKEAGVANLGGDPELSSRHAQVYDHQGALVVNDLGSTNGTWVNDQRVSQPTVLQPGDVLRMGGTTLSVESANGARDGATQMGVAPAMAAAPSPPPAPPAAMVPPPPPGVPGSASSGTGDNKPLIIVAAVLAALVLIGGVVGGVIALTGGDDDKKEKKAATTTPAKPASSTPTTPSTTPSTPATPPPANQSGDVSVDDQAAIKYVIEQFQASGSSGDSAGACERATDDFSVSGQPTDCQAWVQENVGGSELSIDSFKSTTIEGSDGPAVLVRVTNTKTSQPFDVAMDGESGTWMISDIAPGTPPGG